MLLRHSSQRKRSKSLSTTEPLADLRRGSRVRVAVTDFHVDWSFPDQEIVSSAEFIHALVSNDFTDTFGKDSTSLIDFNAMQHPAGQDSFLSLAASDPSGEWLPGNEGTADSSAVTKHLLHSLHSNMTVRRERQQRHGQPEVSPFSTVLAKVFSATPTGRQSKT